MTNKNRKSSVTVALMIVAMVISKLLGMLRGVLLASAYGISENATAFSAASRIPLSFFDIIFGSAIVGCFVPIYNSFSGENAKNEKVRFSSIYFNFVLLLTGLLALLGVIFARGLLNLIAPDMLPETMETAVVLLRLMFPLIVFAGASYTLVGVLQSNDSFIVPAFISAISNLFVIIYFIVGNDKFGIYGLGASYTVAWLLQLLVLIIPLVKNKLTIKAIFDFKDKNFISALKLTPLVIAGSWLAPVCLLISMGFALRTGVPGATPSFEYAINLFTVITGITTYGICNYIFPKLSFEFNSSKESFAGIAKSGLSAALLMTVPIAASVLALAPNMVNVIYLRNNFDTVAGKQVTLILKLLVPGMIGFTLSEVVSRVFYAVKKPIYVVISVFAGIIINFVSAKILVDVFKIGIPALGISYSLGILLSGILMLTVAGVKIHGLISPKYILNLVKILVSGILSAIVMMLVIKLIGKIPYETSMLMNIVYAVIAFIPGMAVYFITLTLLREENIYPVIIKFGKKVID